MNTKTAYQRAFESVRVPEQVRRSVLDISNQEPVRHDMRRAPIRLFLAAAVMFALMAGTVAASGQGLSSFFSQYWQAVFGREMSSQQLQLINSMTQDIGLSQTLNGVTVTLESATVGDDTFFLLLRVSGRTLSDWYSYTFDKWDMTFSPDPVEGDGGVGSYGIQYHGLDDTGAALFLMDQNSAVAGGFSAASQPLKVTLCLEDLRRTGSNTRKLIAEGTWSFEFELDRSNIPKPMKLGERIIRAYNPVTQKGESVTVRGLELTSTGIRFSTPKGEGMDVDWDLSVVLNDGSRIEASGGVGTVSADGTEMNMSYQWMFPVDLEQVTFLKIGQTSVRIH